MTHYGIVIGSGNGASEPGTDGAYGIAIGGSDSQTLKGAFASGLRSIAIGQASVAGTGGGFGASVGFNARSGFAGTAIGTDASALGLLGPVAVGRFAGAGGQQATALGPSANASALRTVALGHAARATHARSVAIGDGSISGGVDTVSVGTTTKQRRIVNVAAAKKNTDAVNLKQVRDLIRDATRSGAGAAATATSVLSAGNVAIGRVRHAALAGAARAGAGSATGTGSEIGTDADDADLEPIPVVGWASVAADGRVVGSRNIIGSERLAIGRHRIAFRRASVATCAFNAVSAKPGFVFVEVDKSGRSVEVTVLNRFGVASDAGFYLMAVC